MYRGKDIDDYYRNKVINLSAELSSTKKIYLDTKFWINLRDYILGRSKIKQIKDIYNLLLDLSRKSIVICPTSQYVFFELIKQSDISTRNATAKLIDEFSKGIVISEEETRIATELKHYFDSKMYYENNVFPLNTLVWTKTVYLFGARDPYFHNLSFRENFEIQKAFIDHLWRFNYQKVLEFLNEKNIPIPDEKSLIDAFNYEKANNPVENISFKNLSYYEFKAILNCYKDNFDSLLKYQREIVKSNHILLNENIKLRNTNDLIEFILGQERKNRINTELPFMKIRAGILAAIRLDIKRKFKITDIKDFEHASVALPYFDYFFTENSLDHLVSKNPLKFNEKYNCIVYSSYDDVVDCLNSIREEN